MGGDIISTTPIQLAPKQMVQLPNLPPGGGKHCQVESNTFLFTVRWDREAVTVEGCTTTGHTWTHSDKVALKWFGRFARQYPLSTFRLTGEQAEAALLIYPMTGKTMVMRSADLDLVREQVLPAILHMATGQGGLEPLGRGSVH